jgi:2-polyprenyl-3-methyl-5-hydroxy-6-metoxy-1,4-benzoquinol methylase
MSSGEVVAFVLSHLVTCSPGKRVLEVGSYESNLRSALTRLGYQVTGVDLMAGPSVDIALDVTKPLPESLRESFDVVICAEVAEHVHDYQALLTGLTSALVAGGRLILTTRSPGYPYHPAPRDYWRYTIGDLTELLRGSEICTVTPDRNHGVMACARVPGTLRPHGGPQLAPLWMGSHPALRRINGALRRSVGSWIDLISK